MCDRVRHRNVLKARLEPGMYQRSDEGVGVIRPPTDRAWVREHPAVLHEVALTSQLKHALQPRRGPLMAELCLHTVDGLLEPVDLAETVLSRREGDSVLAGCV